MVFGMPRANKIGAYVSIAGDAVACFLAASEEVQDAIDRQIRMNRTGPLLESVSKSLFMPLTRPERLHVPKRPARLDLKPALERRIELDAARDRKVGWKL